jgi:hypothetical protein
MSVSLLDLLMNLLNDPAEKAAFVADPAGFLADCGLDDLSPADIHDAIQLAADNERHDLTNHHHGDGHMPPPPPVPSHHGESSHDAAITYLNNYITDNYVTVDARETTIDNSIHQRIDTHGGDLDQVIDNHPVDATGDGAVAVGGDNSGPIATGDHAVAGNGTVAVDGSDDALSFGSGDAVDQHGASADDGGAVSGTGDATGSAEHLTDFGSGSIADDGSNADQTTTTTTTSLDSHDDSHATTTSHFGSDNTTDIDSHADSYADSHDHLLSDDSLDVASHNTDSHEVDHNHVGHAVI